MSCKSIHFFRTHTFFFAGSGRRCPRASCVEFSLTHHGGCVGGWGTRARYRTVLRLAWFYLDPRSRPRVVDFLPQTHCAALLRLALFFNFSNVGKLFFDSSHRGHCAALLLYPRKLHRGFLVMPSASILPTGSPALSYCGLSEFSSFFCRSLCSILST
jgi:hypothetical protein